MAVFVFPVRFIASTICLILCAHGLLFQDHIFRNQTTIGPVVGPGIRKVDGIAASRAHSDILYVQNGGHHAGPIIVVIDATNAKIRGTLHISGIGVHDWQDIAVGPCDSGSVKTCIYIGDTGDDKGHPPANVIYRIEEPPSVEGYQTVHVNGVLKFSYSERGSKTLMVGSDASVYLVSYIQGGAGLLVQFPATSFNNPNRIPARSSFRIDIPHTQHKDPVGGDISVAGNEVLIKTRENVYFWNTENEILYRLSGAKPLSLTYEYVFQDEAICWSASGNGFYILSEGSDVEQPILRFYRRI